jgi:hypothetical protein
MARMKGGESPKSVERKENAKTSSKSAPPVHGSVKKAAHHMEKAAHHNEKAEHHHKEAHKHMKHAHKGGHKHHGHKK